ncbi:MAG: M13-type metalloendopeptidase [Candidatus Limivicinus sp.]
MCSTFHLKTTRAQPGMGSLKAILRIAKEMENFDYDALFRSLGAVWASRGNLQQAYDQLRDEHPMGYLRVNCTLQQFDEFLNFYGIKEGDGMYLAPEDRVAIW